MSHNHSTTLQTYEVFQREIEQFVSQRLIPHLHQARKDRADALKSFIDRELLTLRRLEEKSDGDSELISTVGKMLNRMEKELPELLAFEGFADGFSQIITECEEHTLVSQPEERFQPQQNDGLYVRTAKQVKRMARAAGRGSYRVKNALRSVVGSRSLTYPDWQQKVPVRSVTEALVFKAYPLFVSWARKEWGLVTDLADRLNGWITTWSKAEGCSEQMPILREDAQLMTELQNLLKDSVAAVSEYQDGLEAEISQFEDSFLEQLLKELARSGTVEGESEATYQSLANTRWSAWKQQQSQIKATATEVLEGLNEESRVLIQYARFGRFLGWQLEKTNRTFEDILTNSALAQTEAMVSRISERSNDVTAGAALHELAEELNQEITDTVIAPLKRELEQQRVVNLIRTINSDILLQTASLPEQITIANLDREGPLRVAEVNQYRFNGVLSRYFKQNIFRPLEEEAASAQAKFQTLLEEAVRIAEVVEVNLKSAAELDQQEAEEDGEGPQETATEVAHEGLNRATTRLGEISSLTLNGYQRLEDELNDRVWDAYSTIYSLLKEHRFQELRWKEKELQVKEKALGWRVRLSAGYARLQDYLISRGRWIGQKAKQGWQKIEPWLGAPGDDKQEDRQADIAAYLSETDEQIARLPFIYRKLFDIRSDSDDRFYIAQPALSDKLKRAYENWKRGVMANFALIGERGSGKSLFIHTADSQPWWEHTALEWKLDRTRYERDNLIAELSELLGLEQAGDVRSLINQIQAMKQQNVVIIEGLQNLYIRHLDGFEAIEALLQIISETSDRIFWMVTSSRYAWAYLAKTVALDDHFSHTGRCDHLDADRIKALIMKRHKASGYELLFEPSEEMKQSRIYKKMVSDEDQIQEYLTTTFFKKLAEIAEGNASIAMIFWLRSIRDFDDHTLYIKPLEIASVDALNAVKPDIPFTLASLMLHDTLTPAELAMTLRLSESAARLLLMRLLAKGIVTRQNDAFALNHLVYRQVIRGLTQRNIIHLTEV